MSSVTVLLVLAALTYGGCTAATSEDVCEVIDETATCDETFGFPLALPENITKLHIHSTQVKSISNDDFAQYNELELIDLSNCAITDIDHDAFTGLSKLNELNLAGNTEFSGEKLFMSESLTRLNLSETGIKTIPDNFFEDLPNLQELDLSSTSLTELSISPFLNLPNLSTLIILKNSTFALNSFCNETSLETIVYKIVNGDDETHNCSDLINEDPTAAQEVINTSPTSIINQPESNEESKNTEVKQSVETIETTTVVTGHEETTITVDNTEDNNNMEVNPAAEQETVETSDGTQKNDEDGTAAAEKKDDNVAPVVVEDPKNDTEISSAMTDKETAKSDQPVTENVAMKIEEPVTENAAAQPGNVPQETKETTTETKTVKDTDVFANNTNAKKSNNMFNAGNPPDATREAENKTSEVTSSATQSSGTNVVLGIILTVMVIGAVGFGYKYWKNRRSGYRNANTEDTHEDGKELQTIVTHHTDPEQN